MKKLLVGVMLGAALGGWAADSVQIALRAGKELPLYRCGENAEFQLTVKNGAELLKEGMVTVQLSQSRSVAPQSVQVDLAKGNPAVITGTLNTPGFLLAQVVDAQGFAFDAKQKPSAGAGFDAEKIRPGFTAPADLLTFWAETRKQIEKNPVTLTKEPNLCTDKYDYFRVTVDSVAQEKSYGFLLIPKGTAKCPILIEIPGAGRGANQAGGYYAERGVIYLFMNVHKFAPGETWEEHLKRYAEYNQKCGGSYCLEGMQSRETLFYRTVLASTDKMIHYLSALPQWDGKHLVLRGQSQGGGLSLLLTGMNPHVTAVCAMIPALCDQGATKVSRDPGWPMYVEKAKDAEQAAVYFDAALLCGEIKVPALFLCGMIDRACPPSSVLAAYNNLQGEKEIVYMPETGHEVPEKYRMLAEKWTENALRK